MSDKSRFKKRHAARPGLVKLVDDVSGFDIYSNEATKDPLGRIVKASTEDMMCDPIYWEDASPGPEYHPAIVRPELADRFKQTVAGSWETYTSNWEDINSYWENLSSGTYDIDAEEAAL